MPNQRDLGTNVGDGSGRLPILDHPLDSPTVFSPHELIAAVRKQRGIADASIPVVCVLDFDGDLTDELVRSGEAKLCTGWPCFHTTMWTIEVENVACGIIPRTIGGPYAVLVAEQLAACGVRVILGLASAGRIDPVLPLPAIVIANRAIRDEGTSFHYLPASFSAEGWPGMESRPLGGASTAGHDDSHRNGLDDGCSLPRNRRTGREIQERRSSGRGNAGSVALRLFSSSPGSCWAGRTPHQCAGPSRTDLR